MYDVNQQKSDDLRVLKSTAVLTPTKNNDYTGAALFSTTYEVDLPDDYLHILNCVAEYSVLKTFKCYDAGNKAQFGAKRLTADMFSQIINNYYMRPSYKSPYFYINNVATDIKYPIVNETRTVAWDGGSSETYIINDYIIRIADEIADLCTVSKNDIDYVLTKTSNPNTTLGQYNTLENLGEALEKFLGIQSEYINYNNVNPAPNALLIKDAYTKYGITNIVFPTDTMIVDYGHSRIDNYSYVERTPNLRYGNRSKVRMELRYGKDDSVFQLSKIYIDYLKAPAFIRLTQEQVDNVTDNSQLLEFPDYVCQEITNELIRLLMENGSDPRLQTNIPINQSIANPGQEQPQQKR